MEKTSSASGLNSGRPPSGIFVAAFMAAIVLTPLPAAADQVKYVCVLQNRMPEPMYLSCNEENLPLITFGLEVITLNHGEAWGFYYNKSSEPKKEKSEEGHTTGAGKTTCTLTYAGNKMTGVVVWDVAWPEAESCVQYVGHPECKIVVENRVATLVSGAGGRRVLGDVAVKECSKNYGGWGGWLPFGLGCTYPKHDHPYLGTVVS